MEAKYWHQKWQEEKIGFHQSEVNKRLITFWPKLALPEKPFANSDAPCVFVPLCGKTLDMLWLHGNGYRVLGVELSDKAAEAFFTENQLEFQSRHEGDFLVYEGSGNASGITIMVGDYFTLTPEHCQFCVAFYDRAAMIAMNGDMRTRYAHHLATIMPTGSQGLLLTISYDQDQMQGPPFSVTCENVSEILQNNYIINELAHYSGPGRVGNLKQRGLETLDERVYLLQRK